MEFVEIVSWFLHASIDFTEFKWISVPSSSFVYEENRNDRRFVAYADPFAGHGLERAARRN